MKRVYTWGMACYGALGVPEYIRPRKYGLKRGEGFKTMHRPARCGFAETKGVVDVTCGYGFTVFAVNNEKAHILGTGVNTSGQIGTCTLVNQAALRGLPIGYHAPRVGHPLEMLVQPVPLKLPTKAKAKKVAAGRAHTLVLTDENEVFSLGNDGVISSV